MQIEAGVTRVARPEPWRFGDGGQEVTAAADAGAGGRAVSAYITASFSGRLSDT